MNKKSRLSILKKALNIVDDNKPLVSLEEEEDAKQKAHEIFVEIVKNLRIKGLDY